LKGHVKLVADWLVFWHWIGYQSLETSIYLCDSLKSVAH